MAAMRDGYFLGAGRGHCRILFVGIMAVYFFLSGLSRRFTCDLFGVNDSNSSLCIDRFKLCYLGPYRCVDRIAS